MNLPTLRAELRTWARRRAPYPQHVRRRLRELAKLRFRLLAASSRRPRPASLPLAAWSRV